MQANGTPRFGANLNISYHANIPNSQLDVGKKLNNAKAAVADRIKVIDDKKDTIGINVTVAQDNYEGQLTTRNNGYHSVKPEEKETPASFLNRLVTKAEELAKTLLTSDERTTARIKSADDFLRPVLAAVLGGQAKYLSSNDDLGASARMHSTFGRNAEMEINGTKYHIQKSTRGQRVSFEISTHFSDQFSDVQQFRLSLMPGQGYSEVNFQDRNQHVDFTSIGSSGKFEKPVLALAQRAHQLLRELESRNAFNTVNIDPII